MQWLLSVAGYILSVVDKEHGRPKGAEVAKCARRARADLSKVEDYYDRAGEKVGRIVYFWGMMIGIAALAVIAVPGVWVYSFFVDGFELTDTNTKTFFVCYSMGAIGAIISVLTRMAAKGSDAFVDYEVGRPSLRRVGSFRPVIGAVFAVVLYFALESGLIQLTVDSASDQQWCSSTRRSRSSPASASERRGCCSAVRRRCSAAATTSPRRRSQSPKKLLKGARLDCGGRTRHARERRAGNDRNSRRGRARAGRGDNTPPTEQCRRGLRLGGRGRGRGGGRGHGQVRGRRRCGCRGEDVREERAADPSGPRCGHDECPSRSATNVEEGVEPKAAHTLTVNVAGPADATEPGGKQ